MDEFQRPTEKSEIHVNTNKEVLLKCNLDRFFFARVKGHTDYCGVYNTKAGPDYSEPAFVKK